jgi:hypothetical protein
VTIRPALGWALLGLLWGAAVWLAGIGIKMAVEARPAVLHRLGERPVMAVARPDSLRGCTVELWVVGLDP